MYQHLSAVPIKPNNENEPNNKWNALVQFGIAGLIVSMLSQFLYWRMLTTSMTAVYITVVEIILLLCQTFILLGVARVLRVERNSLASAVGFVGISAFFLSAYEWLPYLVKNSAAAILVLVLLGLILLRIIVSLYGISWSKGLALGVLQAVFTGLIGIFVALIFGLGALMSFTNSVRTGAPVVEAPESPIRGPGTEAQSPPTTASNTVQGNTFESKEFGYSFVYPAGWRHIEPDDPRAPQDKNIAGFEPDDPFGQYGEMQYLAVNPMSSDTPESIEASISQPRYTLESRDTVAVGGMQADRLVVIEQKDIRGLVSRDRTITLILPGTGANKSNISIEASCYTFADPAAHDPCPENLDRLLNTFVLPSFTLK